MKVGLLWFDNDSVRSLEEKVICANNRYQTKYGRRPNVCYVHPSALEGRTQEITYPVRVAPLPSVLRHHFWIGEED